MDSNDAEAKTQGNVAIGRKRRGQRKFAVLLAIHTLLTGTCVVLCFTTRDSMQDPSPTIFRDKGIYLNMKKVPDRNYNYSTLFFTVNWNQSVELKNDSEVMVEHPGPYVFYICVVVDGNGNLTLNQGGTKASIRLGPTTERCARYERLVSLYEKDVVTFSFERAHHNLKLKDLRVGLHYVLGNVSFETPEKLSGNVKSFGK